MHPTKNDLPQPVREKVVDLIQQSLYDVIDLQHQAKQAHWNVKGPQFIALHELFDRVAQQADELADTLAERLVALGGTAEGTVQAVAKKTRLSAYPTTISSGRDHLESLATALAAVGKSGRHGIDQASELKDIDTADVFTELSRKIDKTLWLVEAHLQGER